MEGRIKSPRKILIAGYYGYHNTGDEAILRALLHDLRIIETDIQICVLSGDPENTARLHRVNTIKNTDIRGIIEEARNSDLLIVGGGGIFQDYWGVNMNTLLTENHAGISFYGCLPLLGRLLEKPVLLYGVGVGPLFSQEAKDLTHLTFELVTRIIVRDKESQKLLISLGLPSRKIFVTADSAFTISADFNEAKEILQQSGIDANKEKVAVCLRNWEMKEPEYCWHEEVANALDAYIEQTDCSLIFIPFQDLLSSSLTNDIALAQDVISRMKHKNSTSQLRAGMLPETICGVLSQCDLVVGMRYHSIVFASNMNVPVIALSYDDKVANLMDKLGLGNYSINLSEVTSDKLLAKLNLARNNNKLIRRNILIKVSELKKDAQNNQKILQKLLENKNIKLHYPPIGDRIINNLYLHQTTFLVESQNTIQELGKQIHSLNISIEEKDEAIKHLTNQIEYQTKKNRSLEHQLNEITSSNAWKIIGLMWRIRKILIPKGSYLESAIHWLIRLFKTYRLKWFSFLLPVPTIFQDRYSEEDNSQVTLYTKEPDNWLNYSLIKQLPQFLEYGYLKTSLIACAKNEVNNVVNWMNNVISQTIHPNEIIIVDTGSTDGTLKLLEQEACKSPIPVTIISSPGLNIAKGRNQAITLAKYPFIAVLDFGATPDPEWLELMLAPFYNDPDNCLSGGIYRVVNQKGKMSCFSPLWEWNFPHKIWPQNYLPPGGSIVFRKEIWQEVGGFPEWLTLTGEDTYFDLELKKLGGKWAFVPEATVAWHAPENIFTFLQKMYKWSVGDGEAGIRGQYYWKYLQKLLIFIIFLILALFFPFFVLNSNQFRETLVPTYFLGAFIIGIVCGWAWSVERQVPLRLFPPQLCGGIAQLLGYLRGVQQRHTVDARRWENVSNVVFLLSGVPIDDNGGGARCTQLAREFLRLNYGVVFINHFSKQESKDLRLKILHPNLITHSISGFDFDTFIKTHSNFIKNKNIIAITEHPIPSFLPVIESVRQIGGLVIYDLIDNWNTSLGGKWYSQEIEKMVVDQSQILIASAPVLVENLERLSNRSVHLLPNAVNSSLFNPNLTYQRPLDLPLNQKIVIYIGALWGDWFDWELLKQLAIIHPNTGFIIIGDYQGQCNQAPNNIHFLGLKTQYNLPAYLSYADVAIIPWKVSEVTQATSPLKVYEYLSMGCPVVAPDLEPLGGIPGVFGAKDQNVFIKLVGIIDRTSINKGENNKFIEDNNWRSRVQKLLELL